MKRWLKTLLLLVTIFLLPTLWLLVSHIMAKNALDHYKAQLRAAGEKLTIDELLPPPGPPSQNSATLVLQAYDLNQNELAGYSNHIGPLESNPPTAMRMISPGKAMIAWRQPEIVSYESREWDTNSWADVAKEIKLCSPAIALLQEASRSSRIDFQTDYHDLLNWDWDRGMISRLSAYLLSDAIAVDLHQGYIASSITNLHALLNLINAWKVESAQVSQELRMDMCALAAQSQWEVLQATNVTDTQLVLLQRDWETLDFIRPVERALEMERAWDEITTQRLRNSNSPPTTGSSSILDRIKDLPHGASRGISDILWRNSWSYGDELRVLQRDQATIDCLRRIETNKCFKDAVAEGHRKLSAIPLDDVNENWLRGHLEDELGPSLWNSVNRYENGIQQILQTESLRRITMTAIALKRYKLRHGTWPSDLKALVPEFLSEVPRDPSDGLPLRYHTNADGTFTLYSIGLDNKDDGGDPTPENGRDDLGWLHGHDWVWPQPATPEEIQHYYTTLQQRPSVYK
jgi:hypothetical protein